MVTEAKGTDAGGEGNGNGNILLVDIEEEMRRSYLGYAISTLISRALPDVRDGLKPVQRRILLAMNDLNLTPNAQRIKSAKICGDTSGNYHPHGESVVYPTMVRMAQDFSLRYPLVDPQGNFGSVDGDPPAAMRYTEARMSVFGAEMLVDLDRDTVDWMPNYDQRSQEPVVLPSRFPNFLCNGGEGIAVGMTTKVPPHNLREVCDACTLVLEHPEATLDEIMAVLPGPDFPTAGIILGTKGIREAYQTGRGRIVMQANVHIEPIGGGRHAIVITEIPYQVNKKRLQEDIADLVKARRVDGITAIQDFSNRQGMRVVIELRRDVHPGKILNYLLKHTQLRTTFGVIMLALVDNQPRLLNLKQAIEHYLNHRREIVVRRTRYELGRAKARAHILEGLQIALDFLDEIIRIIRSSEDDQVARSEMMSRFGFTQIQAEAILSMQLRQLTRLNRTRLEDEYKAKLKEIGGYEDILVNPARVTAIIKSELKMLKDKYGDDRRTTIRPMEADEISEEDMIAEEDMLITITRDGYVKRVPMTAYRTQRRGGRGIIGADTREEDVIQHLFVANTLDFILFFTDRGKVYKLKAWEVPETTRTAMGTAIVNLINIEPGDTVTATVPVKDLQNARGYMLMATRNGEIKRVALADFANLRANGLICFDLEDADELRWVKLTNGSAEVIMVTRNGKCIRFKETDVPVRGRPAGGVRGIEMRDQSGQLQDTVVAMDVVKSGEELLVVGEKGIGKRTPIADYPLQHRGGRGVITMAITAKTGAVVGAIVVQPTDRLMIMTQNGIVIRMRVQDIRRTGRSAQGVKLINLDEGDQIASIARIARDEDAETTGRPGTPGAPPEGNGTETAGDGGEPEEEALTDGE
ncbi:MAG: DNA gyrase subunit A [Chthonomonadales bacterium]